MSSNAQVSKITTKPAGYQMTINAKEVGMSLRFKENIAEVKNLLQQYILPDNTIYAEVGPKLDSLEQWITTLMPKVAGLHIDVIGQTHEGGPIDDFIYQTELLASQSLIKNILLANKYTLIGNEGNGSVILTKESILEGGVNNLGSRNKIPANPSIDMLAYDTYGQVRNAVSSLLLSDGFAGRVIGTEDSTFYTLQSMVLTNPAFRPLSDLMVTLRSYIAFFKVAEHMLATKVKHGAIVIGAAHVIDFVWMARSTGVIVDFYHTSNIDFFQSLTPHAFTKE
jgi:hypothetical protein